MIKGIGVDIVHLPRILKLVNKYSARESTLNAIVGKVMCSHEREKFQTLIKDYNNNSSSSKIQKQRSVTYLAGIWATKEALYKSMANFIPHHDMLPAQTIYTKLFFKSNNQTTGAPQVQILNPLTSECQILYEKYLKNSNILVSISHDGDYLIAYTSICTA